jgi:deoxycytidylate deaminase
MNFNKIKDLTISLKDLPKGKSKHFTFILDGNKIISIGWNSKKTHPKTKKWYPYPYIHSEFMAVNQLRRNLKGLTIVNTRIVHGEMALSKPCKYCREMLRFYGAKRIYYSGEEWKCLSL